MAAAFLDLGFDLSFSGVVTFKNADELRAVAQLVPADRYMVETDAPFLAPVPHRGRRNEPAFVVLTAAAVAAARGVTIDDGGGAGGGDHRPALPAARGLTPAQAAQRSSRRRSASRICANVQGLLSVGCGGRRSRSPLPSDRHNPPVTKMTRRATAGRSAASRAYTSSPDRSGSRRSRNTASKAALCSVARASVPVDARSTVEAVARQHRGQGGRDRIVVVDDQCRAGVCRDGHAGGRQPQGERRPAPGRGLHQQLAPVCVDDGVADAQPESRALLLG